LTAHSVVPENSVLCSAPAVNQTPSLNALQFAKRGLTVTLVDNVESRKDSYKVGESFLVVSHLEFFSCPEAGVA
jgi:hypothetical protein